MPPERLSRARTLEESFRGTDRNTLAQQAWAAQICQFHPCADEVTEEQAKDLLRDFVSREQRQQELARAEAQRAEDLTRADRDRLVGWLGTALSILIAAGGLAVSVMAMRQSRRNERDIGRLGGRMDPDEKL